MGGRGRRKGREREGEKGMGKGREGKGKGRKGGWEGEGKDRKGEGKDPTAFWINRTLYRSCFLTIID